MWLSALAVAAAAGGSDDGGSNGSCHSRGCQDLNLNPEATKTRAIGRVFLCVFHATAPHLIYVVALAQQEPFYVTIRLHNAAPCGVSGGGGEGWG